MDGQFFVGVEVGGTVLALVPVQRSAQDLTRDDDDEVVLVVVVVLAE